MNHESDIAFQLSQVQASLPAGVTLVAVSKTHPVGAVRAAYDAGQRIFGESRPQELAAKQAELPHDIVWHMIGHLQTNKIKLIVPFVALIHSVDSARLAGAIQREAAKCGRTVDILLEIHVAAEETKTGWEFAELLAWVQSGAPAQLPNLRMRGVMGIATNTSDESLIRNDFNRLKQCFDRLKPCFDASFDTLSKGMSDDYPLAVDCGSTMVRVGSRIFGARDYSRK